MKHEECEYCDGLADEAVLRVRFRFKKETISVDNVPVRVCCRCGEIYYKAAVYKKLEKVAKSRKTGRVQGNVPVS